MELDTEMTNYDRPNAYSAPRQKDETFVKGESLDCFFGMLFETYPEVLAFRKRRRWMSSWDPVYSDLASLDHGH